MRLKPILIVAAFVLPALSSCSKDGLLDVNEGIGITATRSGCPSVAVPVGTGDITLFNPTNSQDANAIDVVATITKLISSCDDTKAKIATGAQFDVQAWRNNSSGARTVSFPYFFTVMQGGSAVVSKRVAMATVQFADGERKASTTARAGSYIDAESARLPADIIAKITKKRKAGDTDAALDPMADPQVKAALARASFELLIGFQLSEDQLRYNVTR
jgi:hypothetical protein